MILYTKWVNHRPNYLEPESLSGMNLYQYSNNDPVNYSDGFGHMPEWAYWALGTVVLVGTIATAVLSGGTTLAVGAAIGASVGAGVGILNGVTYDCDGVGSLISFGCGLLDFCEPLGNWFDHIWSPMMGAALGWGMILYIMV